MSYSLAFLRSPCFASSTGLQLWRSTHHPSPFPKPPKKRDTKQWCTDRRIHLDVTKMHNQRLVQLDTLLELRRLSLPRRRPRHAVQLLLQTNWTNCCLLYEAQTPTVCAFGISLLSFYHTRTAKHIAKPAFFSFSCGRLVRVAFILSFCLINKKKKKKNSFCGDCSNSMMDVVVTVDWGREKAMIGVLKNGTQLSFHWV